MAGIQFLQQIILQNHQHNLNLAQNPVAPVQQAPDRETWFSHKCTRCFQNVCSVYEIRPDDEATKWKPCNPSACSFCALHMSTLCPGRPLENLFSLAPLSSAFGHRRHHHTSLALPDDIWSVIYQYLDLASAHSLSQTCTPLYRLRYTEFYWTQTHARFAKTTGFPAQFDPSLPPSTGIPEPMLNSLTHSIEEAHLQHEQDCSSPLPPRDMTCLPFAKVRFVTSFCLTYRKFCRKCFSAVGEFKPLAKVTLCSQCADENPLVWKLIGRDNAKNDYLLTDQQLDALAAQSFGGRWFLLCQVQEKSEALYGKGEDAFAAERHRREAAPAATSVSFGEAQRQEQFASHFGRRRHRGGGGRGRGGGS